MVDLVEKFTNHLVRKGEISEDEVNIYRYGFQVAFDVVIETSMLILIGILTKHVVTTIIFILSFTTLRMYTGGYHSSTRIGCACATALSLIVNILCSEAVIRSKYAGIYAICTIVITILVVYMKAPIRNENKILEEDEIPGYRKKAFMFVAINVLIIGLGYVFHRSEGIFICTAILEVSLMMLV